MIYATKWINYQFEGLGAVIRKRQEMVVQRQLAPPSARLKLDLRGFIQSGGRTTDSHDREKRAQSRHPLKDRVDIQLAIRIKQAAVRRPSINF